MLIAGHSRNAPVHFQQLTFRRGQVSSARFTSSGEVLYVAQWEREPRRFFITDSRSPVPRALGFEDLTLQAISPTGELALLRTDKTMNIAGGTLSPGSPISIVVQVENLTTSPIAIADKIADATYDPESQTISMTVGAEIPQATMPHLMIVAPGQRRTFRTAASARFVLSNEHNPWAQVPHAVLITVNVLRDIGPFAALIEQQQRPVA